MSGWKNAHFNEDKLRFWEWVCPDPETGCWVWTGHTSGLYKYPAFFLGDRVRKAHRVAYEWYIGKIPNGLTIDHLCRNKRCVNPWHLEPVTIAVNTLRGFGPTAMNKRKTHCKVGHPLEGNNLIIHKDGRRECRQCSRDCKLASYHRRFGKNSHHWKTRKQLDV